MFKLYAVIFWDYGKHEETSESSPESATVNLMGQKCVHFCFCLCVQAGIPYVGTIFGIHTLWGPTGTDGDLSLVTIGENAVGGSGDWFRL